MLKFHNYQSIGTDRWQPTACHRLVAAQKKIVV